MVYNEINKDLFSVGGDYALAHCISADFALGAGIATEFVKRYDMKMKLKILRPKYVSEWEAHPNKENYGDMIVVKCNNTNICNLITKEFYWKKPTIISLEKSLIKLKDWAIENDINRIAMPKIGCGLDKLKWEDVSKLLKKVFNDTGIEILVCYL